MATRTERRKFERFEYHLPLEIDYAFENRQITELSRFIDISAGGAFVVLNNVIEASQEVALKIHTDVHKVLGIQKDETSENISIHVKAKVIRVVEDPRYPGGVCAGIEFIGPFRITGMSMKN